MMSDTKKKVSVNFDFESLWGMPYTDVEYDLLSTTDKILQVLNKYQVKATFYTVGKIVETDPKLIQKITQQGHQIGIHGYSHEQLANCSGDELKTFSDKLNKVELKLQQLTGNKPVAFRSPYLMGPEFYSDELYQLLSNHGYQSVSNREIRHQQELFHPRRLRIKHWLNKDNLFTRLLTLAINIKLITSENIYNQKGLKHILANSRWLISGAEPFMRHDLLEIPLYSPLDCDLIGLPKPHQPTPPRLVNYAINTLVGGINKKGSYYSLNFHDWIIGSNNRIDILDEVLKQLSLMPNVSFSNQFEPISQYCDVKLVSQTA